MTISQKPISDNHSLISVLLEPADYKAEIEKVFKEYQKKAKIPGFRPGNIPLGVIKKMFGKDVMADKLFHQASDALTKYLTENKLDLLGRPLMKNGHFDEEVNLERNYEFSYEIGIMPLFDLTFPTDKINLYSVRVDNEMIENYIENLRTKYGTVSNPEISGTEDYMKIQYHEVESGGMKIEAGFHGEASFNIGKIPGERERGLFTGIKKGDEVSYTASSENAESSAIILNVTKDRFMNEKKDLKISILKIERVAKAELTDEFLHTLYHRYNVHDMENWKKAIENDFTVSFTSQCEVHFLNEVLNRLTGETEIILPKEYLKGLYIQAAGLNHADFETNEQFDLFLQGMKKEIIKKKIIQNYNLHVNEDELFSYTGAVMQKEYPQFFAGAKEEDVAKKDEYYKTLANLSLKKEGMEEEKEKIINRLYEKKMIEQIKNLVPIENRQVSYHEFLNISKSLIPNHSL